jgi:hypothetical protein
MARTKKVLTRAEAKAMALREGVEAEEEEEEEEEEEDEDEGDEDGEDGDEVDAEELVDGEEEEQQQPDPEAFSEIVQFMREMASDPGRRNMADMAGDIAVKFCHTLDAEKGTGTAKKVLARAFPSGANVFGHLKDLAAQALTLGAIVPRSTEQEVVEEEEKKVVEHISTQDVEELRQDVEDAELRGGMMLR